MLQKPINDADDGDVLAQAWYSRTQATHTANIEADDYARLASFVQCIDNVRINKRVHFACDVGFLSIAFVNGLRLDEGEDLLA